MFPILFESHGIHLYSYGTAILAGAIFGGFLAWYLRPRNLFTLDQFLSICLVTTIGSALGARLAYLFQRGELDADAALATLRFWEKGGLASVGVAVVVAPLLLAYCRWQRLPAVEILDYLLPFTVFGAAFQRTFGCFLAGCCAGKPTAAPWGVTLPGAVHPVHPTQLYLGIGLFALFAFLVSWRPAHPGLKSLATLGLYAVVNLVVNVYRADVGPRAQLLYAAVALLCGLGFLALRRPVDTVRRMRRFRRRRAGALLIWIAPLMLGTSAGADNLRVAWSKETVRWGEPTTLEVSSRNLNGFEVAGGITVSFSSNVIVVRQDSEATLYYENSRVFKVGHRELVRTREIMVENWYKTWPAYAWRTMRLTFFPIKTGVLRVKVRTAQIRSLHPRDVVNYPPASSCKDQQGYSARCFNIFVVESPNLLANLRRIVNTEVAEDPAFLRNLHALIRDPTDPQALEHFGIPRGMNSRGYLKSALGALRDRMRDPSIRNSPELMANLRKLINDPSDVDALRFFRLYQEPKPVDPRQVYVDRCKAYLDAQQAGSNLLSLMAAEGDISFGYTTDDRIVIVYRGRSYPFRKRPGVVLEMIEKIMALKPHSEYINKKEEVNCYSYSELRRTLLKHERRNAR